MVSTVVDWSGVADFKAVPEGDYRVTLSDKKLVAEKGYVATTFTIQDDEVTEYNGQKLFRNYSLKPDALPFLKRDLIILGTDPEVFVGPIDIMELLDEVMGASAIAVVSHRTWNNETRANVDKLKSEGYE